MSSSALEEEVRRYMAKTPRSGALQERAARYLPGGSSRGTAYFDPYPFFVDHAQGHYVYDVDGNRYLDFMINATSLITGHADPAVIAALEAQAHKGLSYSNPTEAQVELARILCERIPSVERVRFTNSGTEGTMMAIRAARAYTGRHKIAKFEGGYHGSHEYVAVSVYTPPDRLDPEGPAPVPEHPGQPPSVAEDVVVLPYNDLEECERRIRAHADELACVIMEPVSSNFGYLPADRDFLRGIRELTQELGIVLIFDEVQSFRVAPGGAQELLDVTPDMTTLGKIIGGGLPVGAFGGREEIMALFDPTGGGPAIPHAGTFNANPMTMVAGMAVLSQLTPEVYDRMARLGETLRAKLRAVFDELEVPAQVTGVASFFGVHFTHEAIRDYRSVVRGDRQMNRALFVGLLNEGVLVQAKVAGALTTLTTDREVDDLVEATRRVVHRLRG